MRYFSLFALLFVMACEAPPIVGSRVATDGDYPYDGVSGQEFGSQFGGVGQGELAAGVYDTIYFATDSSSLNAEAKAVLAAQAEWLKANPVLDVVIEGHCDERGSREYNLALGERRANAVKSYLASLGVDSSKIETISYGKERPVSSGSFPEAWAQNRRGVTLVK